VPVDPYFRRQAVHTSVEVKLTSRVPAPAEQRGTALETAVRLYLVKKEAKNLSQSNVDEIARVLRWLMEQLTPSRSLDAVQKVEMRKFRTDIARMDRTQRGRKAAFKDRLTDSDVDQIASVTALKYWRYVQAFFAWAFAEGHCENDPSVGLILEAKKGQTANSPEAFTSEELQLLLTTPIYTGYRSRDRVADVGECHTRGGHWWAGMLMMWTGMRAGELSQLLVSDFALNDPIPHVKIRREDSSGKIVKTVKNKGAVRDTPLAPVMFELGLAQFIENRSKAGLDVRVFREFRLGAGGRSSDGMTKFWSAYLKRFGLWKVGRATHVWRHTVIAMLRANEVSDEESGAYVGHSPRSVTAGYGGKFPLTRKLKTLEKLDFGFDVVALVGGPFDKRIHT
jgi:integrase